MTSRCGGPGTHPPGRAALAAGGLPYAIHPPLLPSSANAGPEALEGRRELSAGPLAAAGDLGAALRVGAVGLGSIPAPHPLWGKGSAGCLGRYHPGDSPEFS